MVRSTGGTLRAGQFSSCVFACLLRILGWRAFRAAVHSAAVGSNAFNETSNLLL
jgi:hypothetical protein